MTQNARGYFVGSDSGYQSADSHAVQLLLVPVSGYMTDPFKVLSVIDDRAGDNYRGNLRMLMGTTSTCMRRGRILE